MIDSWEVFPYATVFFQHTLAQITCVFAVVIALIQLGLFLNNRSDTQYGWTFLAVAGYAVVSLAFFMPPPADPWQLAWNLLQLIGIQAIAMGGCIYMLNECGVSRTAYTRFASAWSGFFLLVYGGVLVGTGDLLPTGYVLAWCVGLGLASLSPAWPLWQLVVRHRHWQHAVFLVTYMTMGGAALLDATRLFGRPVLVSEIPLLPMVAALWFLAVCLFLVNDFTGSLHAQRQHTAQMAEELAAQKAELSRLHALERASQEAAAAAVERSRIMQDMHDGLGSQLVSSLVMARAGELSSQQTYELLRSCIDDLRLAIDTSHSTEDSLQLALGNLRFRMQPRLKAAGINLHWDTQRLSNPLRLRPQDQLSVLRIIQESLANALKHANAKTISVEASSTEAELVLCIQDDGQGFDVHAAKTQATGKGLHSLDKRARVLGAQLQITSSERGSAIGLRMPLGTGV
ncbi:MAG: ATP-binding protein [Rhodoferax sp.]|nr:ATP-binding protein [Rhodoferax sp.]